MPTPASLRWLVGTWTQKAQDLTITETWRMTESGVLLGAGETRRNGVLVFQETLRIEADPTGRAVYVAWPQGSPSPTRFVAIDGPLKSVEFANPAHDFPKKIRYRVDSSGKLHATVEGDARKEEWTYERSTP